MLHHCDGCGKPSSKVGLLWSFHGVALCKRCRHHKHWRRSKFQFLQES